MEGFSHFLERGEYSLAVLKGKRNRESLFFPEEKEGSNVGKQVVFPGRRVCSDGKGWKTKTATRLKGTVRNMKIIKSILE